MPKSAVLLANYQPPEVIIEQIHLFVDLWDSHAEVRAVMSIQRAVPGARSALRLDGESLQLQSVQCDGVLLAPSEYTVTDDALILPTVPDAFVLETVVHIEPQHNTQLMGLYLSRHNYCTQCEAQGFRRITYFLDRPDVMTVFTTTITADKTAYPHLLANGNQLESVDLENGRHRVTWFDPSLKPCYLFALVAGDFDLLEDQYTTQSGRSVALVLYVERGFVHQADYAMKALKASMAWDESRWGREYDLDIYMIVAVSDFNMGAMENKGLNIFNTKYVLAEPQTATDDDYTAIEKVIGHEYFHNWTGNRITCRDWFQITLKEGLTVFRDQEFTADQTSRHVARLDDVAIIQTSQFAEDAGPLAHPIRPESYIEINNFYTVTVYHKGAEVIRMIETLISPETFKQGLDLYFERHDGQAVTTEDFVACMEAASGIGFTQFKRWYSQAGTPVLAIHDHYDVEQQRYTLTVKQSCPQTTTVGHQPFYLPLSVRLLGVKDPQDQVLVVCESEQSFVFESVETCPTPSLLRGFSAPVVVQYPYTETQLVTLLSEDDDAYVRWSAAQTLATRVILDESDCDSLITAYRSLLEQATLQDDLSLLARCLQWPSQSYCHQQASVIDAERIAQQHARGLKMIATALSALWWQWYDRLTQVKTAYEYTSTQVAQRRLKNLCLLYMMHTDRSQEAIELAQQQYQSADNMTDRLGALYALNQQDTLQRTAMLDAFYAHYQSDPLVVNKWLTLQALAPVPTVFEQVKTLTEHVAFSWQNPNNVYALVCAFTKNLGYFHAKSGEPYAWLAKQVVRLNQQNPQVAARVIQPLTQWRRFDKIYQDSMCAQLKWIAEQPDLSSDLYEIVEKSILS